MSKKELKGELEKGKGICYNCKQKGHFVKECPKIRQFTSTGMHCQRCGRNSHTIGTCVAKTHFNGSSIEREEEREEEDQSRTLTSNDKLVNERLQRVSMDENPIFERNALDPDSDFEHVPISDSEDEEDELEEGGPGKAFKESSSSSSSNSPNSGSEDWGCIIM